MVYSAWLPYKVVARVRDTIKRHSECSKHPPPLYVKGARFTGPISELTKVFTDSNAYSPP